MSLLSKLLDKWGIEKEEDLSIEEKAIYNKYKFVLTGDAVTVDSIKEFCKSQILLIETRFAAPETAHDSYLKACLHVYLNIIKAIEAPQAERETLELHLNQILKS